MRRETVTTYRCETEGCSVGDCPNCLEIAYLRAALAEIAEGRGPFSRDPLTHAANCVTAMKDVAAGALAHTWEPE